MGNISLTMQFIIIFIPVFFLLCCFQFFISVCILYCCYHTSILLSSVQELCASHSTFHILFPFDRHVWTTFYSTQMSFWPLNWMMMMIRYDELTSLSQSLTFPKYNIAKAARVHPYNYMCTHRTAITAITFH